MTRGGKRKGAGRKRIYDMTTNCILPSLSINDTRTHYELMDMNNKEVSDLIKSTLNNIKIKKQFEVMEERKKEGLKITWETLLQTKLINKNI